MTPWVVPGSQISWLGESIIYMTVSGSRAYGTNTPESDIDYRGICIPPREYWLGAMKHFEQTGWSDPDADPETETVVFGIRKFVQLAADCNPNIIELLWTDDEDVIRTSPFAERLRAARELFISKKAKHTYTGYANSQLKRINTHRAWLLNPPARKPTRDDYDLPEHTLIPADHIKAAEAAIQKKLDEWELDLDGLSPAQRQRIAEIVAETTVQDDDRYVHAARTIGLSDNLVDVMRRERQYRSAIRHFQQYQDWKKNRNPARAELEARYGFDLKHASHLVRLYRQGLEILEGKGVLVKRPDAEELRAIRAGAWTYDQLIECAVEQEQRISEAYAKSTLPKVAAINQIDALLISIVTEHFEASL